jgi:hypothetical protein
MKIGHWLAGIAILYVLIFVAHALFLQKTVYGDGIYYFSWLRSVVVDRDINFADEYSYFGVTAPATPSNIPGNKHPVGTPLFWFPWYAQAYMILGKSGYELPYQLLVGSLSVLAALSGLILLYRLLIRSFNLEASLLSVGSIALAGNLLFYGAVDPVNSHAVSFFAATVYLSLLYARHASPFAAGCALGFCALVRPQDAALALLATPHIIGRRTVSVPFAVLFFTGAILVFAPQLLAWQALYTTARVSPYLAGGESFSSWPPQILGVMFSPENGLFFWTPVTLFAAFGLFVWKNRLSIWFLGVFLAYITIVSSWSTWWQGRPIRAGCLSPCFPFSRLDFPPSIKHLLGSG